MKRRDFFILLAGVSLLSACGRSLSMKTLEVALANSTGSAGFDPDYPDRLPYASMAVRLPNVQQALVVLAKEQNGELYWHSADRGLLATRFGRLVRTVGFAEDLTGMRLSGRDFLEPGENLSSGAVYHRQYDLMPGNRFAIPVEAKLRIGPEEEFVVGKRRLRLQLLEEHVQAEVLQWTFVNRFWVDTNRFVWRSEQHTAPGLAPFVLEVMKPYRAS